MLFDARTSSRATVGVLFILGVGCSEPSGEPRDEGGDRLRAPEVPHGEAAGVMERPPAETDVELANTAVELGAVGTEDSAAGVTTGDEENPVPMFTDVSSQLGHTHVDAAYDDFRRQPMLPNKLSQLGPGASFADVDRDGDEDLLIPSGSGGRLALCRNDGGHFTPVALPVEAAQLDQTTVLVLPDEAGNPSLLVGQSIYEAETRAEAAAAK